MSSNTSRAEYAGRWAEADEIECQFEIPLLIAAAFVLPSRVLQTTDQLGSGWQAVLAQNSGTYG